MKKNIFYKNYPFKKNSEIKELLNIKYVDQKKNANVNINMLLNRVKVDKKNEKKKNFIFFSLGIFLIGLMGTFISIIR